MKTLIIHLPGGDKTFTSDEFTFGTPFNGNIEIMKPDGTAHVAFSNVATEVQTSDPEPVIEAAPEEETPPASPVA